MIIILILHLRSGRPLARGNGPTRIISSLADPRWGRGAPAWHPAPSRPDSAPTPAPRRYTAAGEATVLGWTISVASGTSMTCVGCGVAARIPVRVFKSARGSRSALPSGRQAADNLRRCASDAGRRDARIERNGFAEQRLVRHSRRLSRGYRAPKLVHDRGAGERQRPVVLWVLLNQPIGPCLDASGA